MVYDNTKQINLLEIAKKRIFFISICRNASFAHFKEETRHDLRRDEMNNGRLETDPLDCHHYAWWFHTVSQTSHSKLWFI